MREKQIMTLDSKMVGDYIPIRILKNMKAFSKMISFMDMEDTGQFI